MLCIWCRIAILFLFNCILWITKNCPPCYKCNQASKPWLVFPSVVDLLVDHWQQVSQEERPNSRVVSGSPCQGVSKREKAMSGGKPTMPVVWDSQQIHDIMVSIMDPIVLRLVWCIAHHINVSIWSWSICFVMIFLTAFLFQGVHSFDCDIYTCTWANATLFLGGCGATSASSRGHHEFTNNSFNHTLWPTRAAVGSLTLRTRR
jgi:hypothetical protein